MNKELPDTRFLVTYLDKRSDMMKKIALLAILTNSLLFGCPTCVGRISEQSPPFFSDEFYKPDPDSMDELIAAFDDNAMETEGE